MILIAVRPLNAGARGRLAGKQKGTRKTPPETIVARADTGKRRSAALFS
jgi:hypothetical protein